MEPIGLGLVILGAMLLRQVAVGRARETPADFRQIAVSVLQGDFAAVADTTALRGAGVSGSGYTGPGVLGDLQAGLTAAGQGYGAGAAAGAAVMGGKPGTTAVGDYLGGSQGPLESAMRQLGTGKPYIFGAQGPNAYDCSGLIWAACRKVGIYNGPRFLANTSMMTALGSDTVTQVQDYARGDIALWTGKHVGVVSGKDRMFSALNPAKGILDSPISDNTPSLGLPTFWRVSYT